tara:strand:+ start:3218 stop:3514 length:297 start_codon:yes stop_codon:yes gene_type:complete
VTHKKSCSPDRKAALFYFNHDEIHGVEAATNPTEQGVIFLLLHHHRIFAPFIGKTPQCVVESGSAINWKHNMQSRTEHRSYSPLCGQLHLKNTPHSGG